MLIEHAGYHSIIFSPRRLASTANRVAKKLLKLQEKLKFDAIAFRGSSGSGMAFPVSMITGIPLIYVRKEKSYHGRKIEGPDRNVRRYIILDDFMDTGKTVKAIISQIDDQYNYNGWESNVECVGICFFDPSMMYTNKKKLSFKKRDIKIYMV